ncbi:hypothetical protein Xoosp13_320 [Xanthomonas phage Xoo-sp13]|nr:hypothetical protein Xoosp13_320 [Xanthomonas phage Xoo-sp13]
MANSNYIKTLSEFEQIDQRFASGNLSAVTTYIDSLTFPVNIVTSNDGYVVPEADTDRTALYQNSNVIVDYGDGRVSKGLRGLELLAKLCKGVDPSKLFLFNNVIYASTPGKIKSASNDELIDIIIINLGMELLVNKASQVSQSEVTKFRSLCYTIGYEVKSGTFKRENFSSRVLLATKRLAIAAARSGSTK